jgi:hypothetical protein
MSSFARRISMHMSFNGNEHMYISIAWLHVLKSIELGCTRMFTYPCMSNDMSKRK